jgi:type IV secretion system protein VirB10
LPSPFDSQSTDGGATVIADPHASKIAADDPRLRLAQLGGRTLRKGPAIAVGAGLLTGLTAAVGVALQPAAAVHAAKAESEPATSMPAPAIPETLRVSAAPGDQASQAGAARASADAGAFRGPPPPQAYGAVSPSPADRLRQARADEEEKAVGAAILFDTRSSSPALGSLSSPSSPGSPSSPAAAGPGGAPAGPSGQPDDDPNHQARKNQFLESASSGASLESTLEHPQSPYQIQAGTLIPAVLITAINSDIPGPVIAQVRENVYDTVTGNALLVPQGARLLANYDSMVSWGQERILVCWRRLLFPNGDSINLQCAPAADLKGAAGLTDEVDEHWVRLIAGAGITSLLAATAQGASGNQTSFAPTVPQLWATNAAQSVNQTGQQLLRRDLQIQPTITVRPGFSVNVILHKDLSLPPYHDASALSGPQPSAP